MDDFISEVRNVTARIRLVIDPDRDAGFNWHDTIPIFTTLKTLLGTRNFSDEQVQYLKKCSPDYWSPAADQNEQIIGTLTHVAIDVPRKMTELADWRIDSTEKAPNPENKTNLCQSLARLSEVLQYNSRVYATICKARLHNIDFDETSTSRDDYKSFSTTIGLLQSAGKRIQDLLSQVDDPDVTQDDIRDFQEKTRESLCNREDKDREHYGEILIGFNPEKWNSLEVGTRPK